jgi:ribose transport system substrate-binding protein
MSGKGTRKFAVVMVCVVLLAACGSSKKDDAKALDATNTFGRAYGLDAAKTSTEKAFAGTATDVSSTPRAAVKGKHIAVISTGQAILSHQILSDGAVAAAKAAGWQVDLLDAKLNPSAFGDLIRQAISMNVDGILLEAIDCDKVVQPLREAQEKKIPVVGMADYDCNEPYVNAGPPLFSAVINYNNLPSSELGAFFQGYGRDSANYIISQSNATAHVLFINDPSLIVLKHVAAGFNDQMAHAGGSTSVTTLDISAADLGPKVVQQIQAELLKHPDVTWIQSPFSFATLAGIIPAIANQPGKYKVMGGEGLAPEVDALRGGQVTAVNALNSDWLGWAGVDTLNSVLRKESPQPSGVGWILADATHNVPASGTVPSKVDYKAEYKRAWGVS